MSQAALPYRPMEVTFRQKSGREWVARFELGDTASDELCALRVAWKHQAQITASRLPA